MDLVEEMCYWEWALRFQKTHAKPRLTLSLPAACRSGYRFLATAPEPGLPPAAMLPIIMIIGESSEAANKSPIRCFLFLSCLGCDALSQQ